MALKSPHFYGLMVLFITILLMNIYGNSEPNTPIRIIAMILASGSIGWHIGGYYAMQAEVDS